MIRKPLHISIHNVMSVSDRMQSVQVGAVDRHDGLQLQFGR